MRTLYLANWEYNAARVLSALDKIVEDNGGYLATSWPRPVSTYYIVNRHLSEAIEDIKRKLSRCGEKAKPEYVQRLRDDLEKFTAYDNSPIETIHGDYLYTEFILNGAGYYVQMDRNPFFPHMFMKFHLDDKNKATPCYIEEMPSDWVYDWVYDCFFTYTCSQADVVEAANQIFNTLVQSKFSPIYRRGDTRTKIYTKLEVVSGADKN